MLKPCAKQTFKGPLTIIGDEPDEPYDRPPLSKQVLKGWVPATHTKLPRLRAVDADWRLGVAATRLDRANRLVHLANGEEIPFDRLLIATGVRSRPWPNPAEAALEGVYTLRTSNDAARLQSALAAMPRRVLVIGAGFIGSEVASVCRQLGLEVTVAERAAAPLAGALGGVVGAIAAEIQRAHGVDLRLGVSVLALEGDSSWACAARPSLRRNHARSRCGTGIAGFDPQYRMAGRRRARRWLWGVACDAGCRAFDIHGVVTDNIFVAGDIARSPHVLFEYEFLSMEHWDNAVLGAEIAGHNMVSDETKRRPHLLVPAFWSGQFGVNIKSVGVPSFGDEIIFTQGSVKERRFAAAYGRRGRIVGAVTFDHAKWLDYYRAQIERSGPFPPAPVGFDAPPDAQSGAGRLSGQGRPNGSSRCRFDRPRSSRAASRVPTAKPLTQYGQRTALLRD